MSEEENKQIEVILKELQTMHKEAKSPLQPNAIVDAISKLLIALSTIGIAWVGGQLINLDRKMIEIDANQRHMQKQIEFANSALRQPRFTKDDFLIEMKSYEQRLSLSEVELKNRNGFMSEVERRLNTIEKQLYSIEKKQ